MCSSLTLSTTSYTPILHNDSQVVLAYLPVFDNSPRGDVYIPCIHPKSLMELAFEKRVVQLIGTYNEWYATLELSLFQSGFE